jgi:hypothetical protein
MTNSAQKVAAGFAAAYGTLALVWTWTGRGFPFGPHDPGRGGSPLQNLPASVGAPLFAGVLLATAVALLVMSGNDRVRGPLRIALLSGVWAVAACLLVVIPDVRLLMIAGYTPILLVGLPFHWPPVDYSTIFTWTVDNQAISLVGGLLVARAALRWQRRTSEACERCGRRDTPSRWTSTESVARWSKPVTWVAALIPATYAVVRLAWAVGIPLGISRDFLHEMQSTGLVWAGAGLASFALVGTWLTFGLIRPWGERFPRWMVGLAGKRVPIRLATIPASLVAIFVTSASVAFLGTGGVTRLVTGKLDGGALPIVLWPFWGLALGAAAYAYYLRRRPACTSCAQGDLLPGLVKAPAESAY